jgi:hypothetical protein
VDSWKRGVGNLEEEAGRRKLVRVAGRGKLEARKDGRGKLAEEKMEEGI